MSTAQRETLSQLAREDPLASPLVASVACFEYDQAPPAHVREIYGDVRRALSDRYPRAPKNLVKLMPREHAKSEAGTVVIPTWKALDDPNVRILIMSETETQAAGKLEECAEHIERLAPQFGRKLTRNSHTELTLEREATWDQPTIKAAGFETGITGGHYDLLVFDDLVSYDTQRTNGMREKAWEKFQDYLNLGSEGESVFLVLGTRKHPDDLYSQLIAGPAWKTTVRRAIQDWSLVENNEYEVVTAAGKRYKADQIGEIDGETETIVDVDPFREVDVLWPDRWPLESLLLDMISGFGSEQGSLVWKRENQNDAAALQGQILTADMLHFSATKPVDKKLEWYAGLDPAVEDDPQRAAENDTDYWGLAIIAHDPAADTTYVIDVHRRRGMSMAEGLAWVQGHLADYPGIDRCLVEDAQAQRWFVQTGKDRGLDLKGTKSTGKKEDRIISMSARFESGKVQLFAPDASSTGPADAVADTSRWGPFLSEWANFPTGQHDDQLDAVEVSLRNLKRRNTSSGSSAWYDPEY